LNVFTREHNGGTNQVLATFEITEKRHSSTNLCTPNKFQHGRTTEKQEFLSEDSCSEIRIGEAVKAPNREQPALGRVSNCLDVSHPRHGSC
jgi:hypothetical protein